MPVLGAILGRAVVGWVEGFTGWVAFGLLLAIAVATLAAISFTVEPAFAKEKERKGTHHPHAATTSAAASSSTSRRHHSTASTTATLAMGDALAVAVLEARGFTEEDFARAHPGGG